MATLFMFLIRENVDSILSGMQKKAGLVIGAIVIVIVLAVFFLMQSVKSPEQKSASSVASDLGSMTKGSIAGLLAAGKSVNCQMTYPDGNGSGNIYVSDKKMRGDFNVVTDGKGQMSSMIQDGDFTYMWSDADKKGTKFKAVDLKSASPAPGVQSQNVDFDKEGDMKCSSGGVDPSKFTVPTDIEFTDMSAMMEKAQEQGGMMQGAPESACDTITDPQAKASCLDSFNSR